MDCEKYRKLYRRFSKLPLPREVWDTPEHEAYEEHESECKKCAEWYLLAKAKRKGARIKAHPCVHIAYHSTPDPDSSLPSQDDPVVPILYYKSAKCYGIPIRDGGSSFYQIDFCPWCGIPLSKKSTLAPNK